jgi:predicted site-specific integrase-resolvase
MPSAPARGILDLVADEPFVTTAVAAKAIGVGTSTLQRWAARGLVTPALRTPGGQARWLVSELRDQLRVRPAEPE